MFFKTSKNIDTSDWGRTYGQMVSKEFFKGTLNKFCLSFIVFLFVVAVFAPLLATDKPLAMKMNGSWSFPAFTGFTATDYMVFSAAVLASVLVFLIRRNQRCVDPSIRGHVFNCQVKIILSVFIVACIIAQYSVPKRLDNKDYKFMFSSGQIQKAVFAPVPYSYAKTNLKMKETSPSLDSHWLGTDRVGADVLCRLIHGSRISLSVGFVAVGISSVLGIAIGALMGYFGGKTDFILMRFVEIFMAIPVFLLILTIIAIYDRSLFNIMVIIGLTTWTGNARFIRAEFFKLRGQDYVQAAKSLGLPLKSILFRHMLPNGIAPVLVNATFGIAGAIFTESALSFLGFGVEPPTPSWGQMLSEGISTTGQFRWWLSIYPGLAIFLTVTSYNLVGEGLRDAIDPRLRKAA